MEDRIKLRLHAWHLAEACLLLMDRHGAGVVWTMKFSKNGKYLASAGQDAAVRVWEVCLNRGEAKAESESEQSVSEAGGDSPSCIGMYGRHSQCSHSGVCF